MEEKGSNNKFIWIFGAILLILILIAFVPGLLDSKKELDATKLEYNLIQEGKVKTPDKVIDEIIEILKNKEEDKFKQFLSSDFIYYDNDNIEYNYSNSFLKDLQIYTSSCEVERRGDIYQDDIVTYWIYWNIVEQNKANGVIKSDTNYCLQRIYIYLKKVVKEDMITYEIEKIILKNR